MPTGFGDFHAAFVVEIKALPDQELVIAGRPLKCTVRRVRYRGREDHPNEHAVQIWESALLPGKVAKFEASLTDSDDPAGKLTLTVRGQVAAFEQTVADAGKSYSCVRLDVRETEANGKESRTARYWLSGEVPGLLLKCEVNRPSGERRTFQVEAFEVPK